ncbi:MAG: serine/threonine-protein kinase [Alphaproteobacteria bacterium]|nr:serine/threonine-protein kinase [Alphaproteobacteria bacterium]
MEETSVNASDETLDPIKQFRNAFAEEDKKEEAQETVKETVVLKTSKKSVVQIGGEFYVYPDSPIPALDMQNAKAFKAEAIDKSQSKVYALVCNPDLPIRNDHITKRKGLKLAGLLRLVDAEVAMWPDFNRKTMILIYDYPEGGRVGTGMRFTPKFTKDEVNIGPKWVSPILSALSELSERGLTHRAIRPDNLYYLDEEKTQVVLGDCISAPPAFEQNDSLEPIPSMMCNPIGRGDGSIADDLYSLGGTLVWLAVGYNSTEGMTNDELIELKLSKGSYAALLGHERIVLALTELLRGLLLDDENLRWNTIQVQQWIDGRRATPLQNRITKTSSRSIQYCGAEYDNYPLFAYALMKNWDSAAETIRSERFETWILRGFEDKPMLAAINAAKELAIIQFSNREKQNDYLVFRTILNLYEHAPIVMRGYRFMPSAIGYMLAYSYMHNEDVTTITMMILKGYLEAWYQVHQNLQAIQALKTVSNNIQRQELGLGIERVLYELCDGVPCQSPLIKKEYCVSERDILPAIENASKTVDTSQLPLDRHIAAFLMIHYSSKIGEAISDTNSSHPGIAARGLLRAYATLQAVFGPEKLNGLSSWMGNHIAEMIKNYHNLETRMNLEKTLPKLIRKGSLVEVYQTLDNPEAKQKDQQDFLNAQKEFAGMAKEVEELETNRSKRIDQCIRLGYEVSAIVSVGIALLVMFLLLLGRVMK